MNKVMKVQRQINNSELHAQNSKLPAGWRWVRLGEVCEIITGSTPSTDDPSNWDGDILWATPNDMGKLKRFTIEDTERRISEKGFKSCSTKLLPVGSVLLTTRAPIGHLAINTKPMCTNQGFKSLIPSPEIYNWFLFFVLKYFVPVLQSMGRGQTFTEISKRQVEKFDIPLPSLPEQKRIASKIQELMQEIERARMACEKQLEAARTLPAAYLREVFESEEAKKWERRRLGEVCEIDSNQVIPDSNLAKQLPYIGLEHIESETGRIIEKINDSNGKAIQSNTFRFDSRHVLYGKLRPYLNKVATPDFEGRCTTELLPLLPKDGCDRNYLAWLLKRQETVEEAMRHKTGSRMPRADIDKLFKMLIPFPPLSIQQQIASYLKGKMAEVENLQSAIRNQQFALDALPQAILRKAFWGEI